jgi:TIR domain
LHADLQQANVRCWFAPEDLKIGDKFRTRIDESIRLYDKLMVVLTEHSIRSPGLAQTFLFRSAPAGHRPQLRLPRSFPLAR